MLLEIRMYSLSSLFLGNNKSMSSFMKQQLAFLLARAQVPLEWLYDGDISEEFSQDILECLSNTKLSYNFREFGKELGVSDPKSLEDVYKSHLENTSTISSRTEFQWKLKASIRNHNQRGFSSGQPRGNVC
jgi:hypothetical protein